MVCIMPLHISKTMQLCCYYIIISVIKTTLTSGWRLCSLRYLHHPAVHPTQLVWDILQVKKYRDYVLLLPKLCLTPVPFANCWFLSSFPAEWSRLPLLTWKTCSNFSKKIKRYVYRWVNICSGDISGGFLCVLSFLWSLYVAWCRWRMK